MMAAEQEWLEKKADEIRTKYLQYVNKTGRSHVGGSLSMCEIVVALYYRFMKYDIGNYSDPDRDRFILSKGHCSELLYIIFSDMGLYEFDELVQERGRMNGRFSGHADRRYLPYIEVSTGSLGHGLPVAAGCAHAAITGKPYKVFCLLGDGELNEGSNWEAVMYAVHNSLHNLVIIIDRNGYSSCQKTEDIMGLEDLDSKFLSFGCEVLRINGNAMKDVCYALELALNRSDPKKPFVVIACTKKGYGIRAAMDMPGEWHHREVSDEILEEFMKGEKSL